MPQKPKKNKIKINDKKITNYMFDFTRTIIFAFAIIFRRVYFYHQRCQCCGKFDA